MLSSFRELLNVTRKADSPVKKPQNKRLVEVGAGSELLGHYRTQWELMHAANENNARDAQQLARHVADIERRVTLDRKNADLIVNMLTESVSPMVKTCTRQMEELLQCFKAVETDLLALEDSADAREMERAKQANLSRLEGHKAGRSDALVGLRARLEAGHREALLRRETLERHRQEERRLVFQEAFRSDLEQYRILGAVPRAQAVAQADRAPTALLEEIQIDQDTSELDSFLEGDGS